ncbi:hypothetical protein D3C81_1212620 [compost metagenome]
MNARGLRCLVYLQHFVEVLHVDGHHATVTIVLGRIHAGHDAGAAAVRNCSNVLAPAPVEQVHDVLLSARVGDDVRRVGKFPAHCARNIHGARAVGVIQAVVMIACADFAKRRVTLIAPPVKLTTTFLHCCLLCDVVIDYIRYGNLHQRL